MQAIDHRQLIADRDRNYCRSPAAAASEDGPAFCWKAAVQAFVSKGSNPRRQLSSPGCPVVVSHGRYRARLKLPSRAGVPTGSVQRFSAGLAVVLVRPVLCIESNPAVSVTASLRSRRTTEGTIAGVVSGQHLGCSAFSLCLARLRLARTTTAQQQRHGGQSPSPNNNNSTTAATTHRSARTRRTEHGRPG